jgi:hypothetical protein
MNHDNDAGPRPFWRSPLGMVLLGSLAIAGFFLLAEHRAHILAGEWGTALLLLAFIGLHFLMHAGHGGHGRHGGNDRTTRSDGRRERQNQNSENANEPRPHGDSGHGAHR